tara:strand:- start:836 stop:1030 length:195 start_codon:yes stop_codon:yes gene_type:complete
MDCSFRQEKNRTVDSKKLFLHEHIGNTIIDLVMSGRWLKGMNESELGIFNKKLEKINDLIEELQ